jgi:hypothetical protein
LIFASCNSTRDLQGQKNALVAREGSLGERLRNLNVQERDHKLWLENAEAEFQQKRAVIEKQARDVQQQKTYLTAREVLLKDSEESLSSRLHEVREQEKVLRLMAEKAKNAEVETETKRAEIEKSVLEMQEKRDVLELRIAFLDGRERTFGRLSTSAYPKVNGKRSVPSVPLPYEEFEDKYSEGEPAGSDDEAISESGVRGGAIDDTSVEGVVEGGEMDAGEESEADNRSFSSEDSYDMIETPFGSDDEM